MFTYAGRCSAIACLLECQSCLNAAHRIEFALIFFSHASLPHIHLKLFFFYLTAICNRMSS